MVPEPLLRHSGVFLHMSTLNKSQIRKFLLEYAERTRHHHFTRVSPSVYELLEAKVRECCRQIVDGQPSKGETIKT